MKRKKVHIFKVVGQMPSEEQNILLVTMELSREK